MLTVILVLLEAFLIPSLVLGMKWMAAHLREHTGAIINMLQKLLRPGTLRTDAAATHRTVLSMIKIPLCQELNNLLKAEPQRQEVKGLIDSLQSVEGYTRISTAKPMAPLTWAGAATGDVLDTIRRSIASLSYFASNPTMSATLPEYSFQHLQSAIELCGAKETLRQLTEAVQEQVPLGQKEIALDIATMLIFSSCVQPSLSGGANNDLDRPLIAGRLTLQEALHLEVEKATKEMAQDATRYNILLLLDRRVQEAVQSSAGTYIPMIPAPDLMTGINITDAMSNLDPVQTADIPTDLTLGSEGLQMDLDTALASAAIGDDKGFQSTSHIMDTGGLDTTDEDFWNELQLDDNLGMDFGQGA